MTAKVHRFAIITHAGQALQDAAVLGGLRIVALRPQRIELHLQALEFFDALGHVADMFIQQRIHRFAVLLGRITKLQQAAHLIQRHIE